MPASMDAIALASDARASRSESSLSARVSWAVARTTGFASGIVGERAEGGGDLADRMGPLVGDDGGASWSLRSV